MKTSMQDTSLDAFQSIKHTLGGKHLSVLAALKLGSKTNTELAEYLGWRINTVTPRVFELREMGMVEKKCERQCSITGRYVIEWGLKVFTSEKYTQFKD